MARRSRIILGLNSGTSADGIDAVACEITGRGLNMRAGVLGHVHRRYDPILKKRVMAVMAPARTTTEELCELDTAVGRAFARVARAAVKKLGLKRVDLIGSHGQTVCHLPPGLGLARRSLPDRRRKTAALPGTMQIGDPAVIAMQLRTGVVSQFRRADMAVGGQGAPLVPWTDYVLLHDAKRSRVIQNIGGIANLTYLPAGEPPEKVVAFDTGPGNMMIDALVQYFTNGREQFDRNGKRAARGTPHPLILERLLDHSFLGMSPPKSCGREDFGDAWLRQTMASHAGRRVSADDWIATATTFTAASIARAIARFLPARRGSRPRVDEVIACGGGAKNPTLMKALATHLSHELETEIDGAKLTTTAAHGIDPQAKEAVSFALLAAACVDGIPANLTNVTGARCQVVLGQVCSPGLS